MRACMGSQTHNAHARMQSYLPTIKHARNCTRAHTHTHASTHTCLYKLDVHACRCQHESHACTSRLTHARARTHAAMLTRTWNVRLRTCARIGIDMNLTYACGFVRACVACMQAPNRAGTNLTHACAHAHKHIIDRSVRTRTCTHDPMHTQLHARAWARQVKRGHIRAHAYRNILCRITHDEQHPV